MSDTVRGRHNPEAGRTDGVAAPDLPFRMMADAAPVLMWTSDRSGGCDWLNRAWLDFTGRALPDELGDGWAEGIHPDDRERCLATYRRAFEARAPYEAEYRLRHRDGDHRWVLDRGVPRFDADGRFAGFIGSCVDIDDRQRLLVEEQAARAEAQRVSVRLAQLQGITAKLAAAPDEDGVHALVVEEVLEASGADALSIGRLDPDGTALRVAAAHGYSDEVLGRWLTVPLDSPAPLAHAVRASESVFCASLDEILERFPAIADDVRLGGRQALAAVPLIIGGRVIGALGMSFAEPQRFDEGERRFLGAIAVESAAALDRAAGRAAERRAQARLEFLFGATRGLAGLTSPDGVLVVATELAVGALCDVVATYVPEGHRLVRRTVAHVDPLLDERLRATVGTAEVPVDGEGPVALAHRRREVVVLDDLPPDEGAGLLPELPLVSGRAIPLLVDGVSEAVVVLGCAGEDPPLVDEPLLGSFATRVSTALTVAHRYTRERDTAVALQRAVMPSAVPSAGRWEVAARYLPADAESLVGGDWYDVLHLPTGCVAASVGDVAGHGLAAATAMVEARNALRVCAVEHDDPGDALTHANAFLHGAMPFGPGGFATALLAIFDPDGGDLHWASAGHPPLVARIATSVAAHPARGLLLGPFGDSTHEVRSLVLGAGDVAVLYTDGLVERPHELLDDSVGRLVAALGEVDPAADAEGIADHLVATCARGQDRRDDTCLLVLRRRS